MKEINFGPVANPDGTPTELTKQMLAGTGRDIEQFTRQAWRSQSQILVDEINASNGLEDRLCPACGRSFQCPEGYPQDGVCEFHNADGTIDQEYVEEVEALAQARQSILDHMDRRDGFGPVTVISAEGTGKAMLHEDDHLEMLHEDCYPEPDLD